jgi:protocatechuate 3,4-dioxygenase beta subunit
MDNDDLPIGRVFSRRSALILLGAAGYSFWTGSGRAGGPTRLARESGCVARPEQTQGPYFVDELLHRSDLRTDPSDGTVRPGAPLELTFAVSSLSGTACLPLSGWMVDLWQCDHLGVYSDVKDPAFNTVGKRFLRGYQLTDDKGQARFTTIYPGWYPGRTVHIHFKIRSPASRGKGFAFTSQVYFDDGLTDRVFQDRPYAARPDRTTRNLADGIFRRGGSQLVLDLAPKGAGHAGTFDVALTGV